ncbi:hypothetical protein JCM5350_001126 [Sporobolomyces pararoseus]
MAPRPRTTPSGVSTGGYNLPPDLFVLVRPPPSASTHPLNLQIQLLVPSIARSTNAAANGEPLGSAQSRRSGEYSRSSSRNGSIAEEGGSSSIGGGNSAVSFDAIAGASVSRSGSRSSDNHDEGIAQSGEVLSRTCSRGSTRSRGSTNSASVRSDTTSASGGGGTRRRVTPLLNLNFHSVLPTVVTDAGTDQRVAKFLKRGIEMSNLAIIDPIDLSQPPPVPSNSTFKGSTISPQTSPPLNGSSTSTPAASSTPTNNLFSKFRRFTLGSSSSSSPTSKTSSSSQQQQGLSSSPSASSFSLFSRSTSTSSNLSSSSTVHHHSSPSKFLPSLVNSEGAPTPRTVPLLRGNSDETTPTTSTTNSVQSPVSTSFPPLHPPPPKSPTISATTSPTAPTTIGYAFVVRKWLREDLVQISEPGGVPGENTAIRIEWVRASDQEYKRMGKKKNKNRGRRRSESIGRGGAPTTTMTTNESNFSSSSRRSSEIPPIVPEDEELNTVSPTTSTSSPPLHTTTSEDSRPIQEEEEEEEEEDDGESSDPEDSERPFICTLFYPSSSSTTAAATTTTTSPSTSSTSPPSSSSMQPSRSLRRLQLATLRPAPHHPKLISTLLLPPTLPSIPLGSFSPDQGLQGGVLSNEVLRDLVHTTSMWLSIREGLGGLGKDKEVNYHGQNIAAGLGLVKVGSGKVGRTFRGLKR